MHTDRESSRKDMWKGKKYGWMVLALAVLFGVQCLSILLCNVFMTPKNLDCDMAMLYVHTIEMWKNKTLLIPDWMYLTSLELDCPALFATLFFGITGNIYLAYGLSHMCILGIFAWTFFRIFRGWGNALYPLLCLNLITIPYGIGQLDYFNMTFFNGGQYAIKVLLPLMLVSILLNGKVKWDVKGILYAALYFILLFVSGLSSGIYVFACGIFPVFMGFFVWSLYNRQRLGRFFVGCGVLNLAVVAVGLLMNKFFLAGASNARGMNMTLCSIWDIKDNITNCFWGIFELFEAVTYNDATAVMSYHGINILFRMAFVILMLGCAVCMVRRCIRKEADTLSVLLLCIFLWNTFILCVCKTQYGSPTFEYRYHLVGVIPLLCVMAIWLVEEFEKCDLQWRNLGAACCLLVLLVLNATSYKAVFDAETDTTILQAICDYAKGEQIETVYFLDSTTDSELCRLLDYENVSYLYATGGGTSLAYNYYGSCTGAPIEQENMILVADTRYREAGETLELAEQTYHYVMTVGTYNIYR